MKMKTATLLTAALTVGLPIGTAYAGALETQSNPVANGAITVAPLDLDRSDWVGIPQYQNDVDAVTPVLSIQSVGIAHDDNNFYFHMLMDAFDPLVPEQSFFSSHHAFFIDADQDRSTGFIDGDGDPATDDSLLPIGADYLIEGPSVFRFGTLANGGGTNQEKWGWAPVVPFGFVNFDDGPPSDIEFELQRSDIGNPVAFDFVAYTTDLNFDTQDTYPGANAGFDPLGDYFTYSTVPVALAGDLDGDGFVGINDLNIVLGAWNQSVPPANPLADPSGDGFVGIDDLNTVLGNWNAGTPPASGAAVPEPASLVLLSLGGVALLRRRA